MSCTFCLSDRIASVKAKCSDFFDFASNKAEHSGYEPEDIGIGGYEYIAFDYCLNCGKIQGDFPVGDISFPFKKDDLVYGVIHSSSVDQEREDIRYKIKLNSGEIVSDIMEDLIYFEIDLKNRAMLSDDNILEVQIKARALLKDAVALIWECNYLLNDNKLIYNCVEDISGGGTYEEINDCLNHMGFKSCDPEDEEEFPDPNDYEDLEENEDLGVDSLSKEEMDSFYEEDDE